MSMEKRILIAFVLSAVIFAVWTAMFPPPKPATPTPVSQQRVESGQERVEEEAAVSEAQIEDAEGEAILGAIEGTEETTYPLENDVLDLSLSNRGAAVTKIILKGFLGDDGQPLDLVQGVEHPERALPLQLITGDFPDNRLYQAEVLGETIVFRWADGLGNSVVKTITLAAEGYGLQATVETAGDMKNASLSVGTGMRNTGNTEQSNRFATWGDITISADGERETFAERRRTSGRGCS